jgi:hypothetical protein
MAKRRAFELIFAPQVLSQLESIESKYHGLLRRTINEQLSHSPHAETRNRKPLARPGPFESSWELRCGPQNRFRVFYDVYADDGRVEILAIGVKDRSRLMIGAEEYEP